MRELKTALRKVRRGYTCSQSVWSFVTMEPRTCPFRETRAEFQPEISDGIQLLTVDGIHVYVTKLALLELEEDLAGRTTPDLSGMRHLVRSKIWRQRVRSERPILVVSEADTEMVRRGAAQSYLVLSIPEEAVEATRLGIKEKALGTLENLYLYWRAYHKFPAIPCYRKLGLGSMFVFRKENPKDSMAYGCDDLTAPIVYEWLKKAEYIADVRTGQDTSELSITMEGLQEIENIENARESELKRGFFVRRFDSDLDNFFSPLMESVRLETGCDISAVWERPTNGRLDEAILSQIRQSAVVVVDVTGERFNVGLEIGYAMALHKQIVVVRDQDDSTLLEIKGKGERDRRLPFDIGTLNCYFYDRKDASALKDVLIARVREAVYQHKVGLGLVHARGH